MIWVLRFFLGIFLGSVANALIDRLPRKESWFVGRSHCDYCGHVLALGDLIPVLSYVFLEGKCRYCKKRINVRNLVVEVFLGVGFLFLGNPLLCLLLWITTIVFVMDQETMLVSDAMITVWTLLVIGYKLLVVGFSVSDIWGVLVGVGVIGGIWLVSRGRAMGSGDIEIAAVMGLWLGWPKTIPALWLAFVLGAIVSCWLLVAQKRNIKSMIAFGPFLVIGTWIAFFWGDIIVTWIFHY